MLNSILRTLQHHQAQEESKCKEDPFATQIASGNVDEVKAALQSNRSLLFTPLRYPLCSSEELITPLQVAARNGQNAIVEILMALAAEMKVDITGEFNKVFTPLELALNHYHFTTAEVLLAKGARVDALGGSPKLTSGHYFAHRNQPLALGFLLSHGLNVDAPDETGSTMLMTASGSPNIPLSTVQMLLSHNANVDMEKADGTTALYNAFESGSREIAAVLLLLGNADPTRGKTTEWLRDHPEDAQMVSRIVKYRDEQPVDCKMCQVPCTP